MTTLIPAFCKGTELQKQIHQARSKGSPDHFQLWWLGQSGYLLQWNKRCLLFDPYLSDSLTQKYLTTPTPHTRMSELVIAPELLDCLDIVTSSHNHTDHLDAETLQPLLKTNPNITFIIPEANRQFVADRVKCDPEFPVGLTDNQKIDLKGFSFHGVPAKHPTIERDEHGRCRCMGYVVRFGKWTLYHSGDTTWFDEMVDLLKPFQVDIAILPINGDVPSRGVIGNLNEEEAARLGKQIGAKLVIPCHYDLFAFNSADPENFVKEARKAGQSFKVLKLGEMLSFS